MGGAGVGRKPKDIGVSVDELARRYRSGETIEAIAAAVGVDPRTVRQRLRRAGVELRPPGRCRGYRLLHLDDAEIVRRYRAGETMPAIGRSLGVSAATVRDRLMDAGVERRPRGGGRRPRPIETPRERARSKFGWGPAEVEIGFPDESEPPFGEEPRPWKPPGPVE
jgi:hypothetical protein